MSGSSGGSGGSGACRVQKVFASELLSVRLPVQSYDEAEDGCGHKEGTIVILLSIDSKLSDNAMMQAIMLATESKSCVIQELQARSLYTTEIATGSGTDQVCVISNTDSGNRLDKIDRRSDLARTISECVKEGLREAFIKQSGMDTELQSDVMTILSRYNLTRDTIRDEIRYTATMAELESALEDIRRDKYMASMAFAVLEIQDLVRKDIVDESHGLELAKRVCTEAVLDGRVGPVEAQRIEYTETIPELVSYVAALALYRRVEDRRQSA